MNTDKNKKIVVILNDSEGSYTATYKKQGLKLIHHRGHGGHREKRMIVKCAADAINK